MENNDKLQSIQERISQMIQVFAKGNKSAFGRQANIQSGVLAGLVGGRMNSPSFDVTQKLLTSFPQVREQWLVLGSGSMLKPEFDPESLMECMAFAEAALRRPGTYFNSTEVRAALSTLENIKSRLISLEPAADAVANGVYPIYEISRAQPYKTLLTGLSSNISVLADIELDCLETEKAEKPDGQSNAGSQYHQEKFIEITDETGRKVLIAVSAISHVYRDNSQGMSIIELKTRGEKSNLKLGVIASYEEIKQMVSA